MSGMYAWIVRVKGVFHSVIPVIVKTMPIMGTSGIIGQSIMRIILRMLSIMIIMVPVVKRISREKKPTIREMRRSINIWNRISREACALELEADIWRNGLNNVRIRESMEKKSVMFERMDLFFLIKTLQPCKYHQMKGLISIIVYIIIP